MIDLLIVGGGPCGLATAISARRAGLSTLVLEGASVVSTIAHYPTYVKFFSTAEKAVARRTAVRRRDGEARTSRRARVLSSRREAFRDSSSPVRARHIDPARPRGSFSSHRIPDRAESCARERKQS
jgi:flavin-dependent dehydrogenase